MCVDEHPECARYSGIQVPQLPTRVVDVGPPDADQDPVLTVSDDRRARYVALSHCWGSSLTATTTSANLARQQRGIPLQTLPRSFRDAVTITKAMGCRYLWVDALCILQDSSDDWDVESSRMHLVYRNALVTILAARASDSEGGCFAPRNPYLNRPFALRVSDNGHPEKETFWSLTAGRSPHGGARSEHREGCPLYQRAWVFQEQALSGRTIAYGVDSIHWSCRSGDRSESDPHCRRRPWHWDDNRFPWFQEEVVRADSRSASRLERVKTRDHTGLGYDRWQNMVQGYSARSLTYDNDRLPAISAVAEQMNRILKDQYVAGLWRRNLVRDLVWRLNLENKVRRRRISPPRVYVAPSWSWASVVGGVWWKQEDTELEDRNLDTTVRRYQSRQMNWYGLLNRTTW